MFRLTFTSLIYVVVYLVRVNHGLTLTVYVIYVNTLSLLLILWYYH